MISQSKICNTVLILAVLYRLQGFSFCSIFLFFYATKSMYLKPKCDNEFYVTYKSGPFMPGQSRFLEASLVRKRTASLKMSKKTDFFFTTHSSLKLECSSKWWTSATPYSACGSCMRKYGMCFFLLQMTLNSKIERAEVSSVLINAFFLLLFFFILSTPLFDALLAPFVMKMGFIPMNFWPWALFKWSWDLFQMSTLRK